MKTRVAVPAALLALIALLSFAILNTWNIRDNAEQCIDSEIQSICQSVNSALVEIEEKTGTPSIEKISFSDDIGAGLYDENGTLIWSNELFELPTQIMKGLLAGAKTKTKSISLTTIDGKKLNVALAGHGDGHYVVICTEANKALILKHVSGYIITAMILAVVLILFIMMWTSMDRKEKLVRGVMRTLDDFSNGQFDSRIPSIPGKTLEIESYNAIIASIQKRIFDQRSRNQAVSVVMNQMQTGIIAVDRDLNIMLVTPIAKSLLGIHGNSEGKPITEASNDVNLTHVFQEAMQQQGVYTNDIAARTAVGRGRRPLRLYVSCMRDDNKVVGALAMIEDITELRRLEQVRTDFAANVSHELKTPLTSIRGFVETLDAGAIDNPEAAHKFLNIIMMETERLTRLINDILSISKLESGDEEVAIERIRLDKIAYDVTEMLAIQARNKQVELNVHMNDKPIIIMGNKDRVQQLLINLVENAIKYNKDDGTGSVTVQVFDTKSTAQIAISDTGIGIPEESLPRIFERFYRVDKGRSRKMGGTGLGLAIVKHIVRSMGGEIEVHSKFGVGTEFLITLPLAPAQNPEQDTIFND